MKLLTKAVFAVPLVLAATIFSCSSTLAQVSSPSRENLPQDRCLSGYPDGKYKGDRPSTRYEFAAGMNACLEQVNQLFPVNTNRATRADFEALIKRQRELNQQLRQLNQRVGNPSSN